MKILNEKAFRRAADVVLMIIALWFFAIAAFEDVVFEARLARLAVALACIANLFSRRERIKRILLFVSVVWVVIATLIYIYK